MSIFKKRLAAIPLALMIGGMVMSPVHAQNLEAKTGTGPRGTPAAQSTDPSQAQPSPRPPVGMEKSGTPVARSNDSSREAMSGKPDQMAGKPKQQ